MTATMMTKDQCMFENLRVRISGSAMTHLQYFEIYPLTLCDMLNDPYPCPKSKKTGRPFRKASRRVCSRHGGKTYNIILDQYSIGEEHFWSVSHLEPIS